MKHALTDMVKRVANAQSAFADILVARAGLSPAVAKNLTKFYLQHKLAKLDPVGGTIKVIHGTLLDRDVILAAVKGMHAGLE